jgi:hypothetical protein
MVFRLKQIVQSFEALFSGAKMKKRNPSGHSGFLLPPNKALPQQIFRAASRQIEFLLRVE